MITSAKNLPVAIAFGWLYRFHFYCNAEMSEMLHAAGFCAIRVETKRLLSQVCFVRKSTHVAPSSLSVFAVNRVCSYLLQKKSNLTPSKLMKYRGYLPGVGHLLVGLFLAVGMGIRIVVLVKLLGVYLLEDGGRKRQLFSAGFRFGQKKRPCAGHNTCCNESGWEIASTTIQIS